MYSFQVVIEVDDSGREKGGVKNIHEFYVANCFDDVYKKASESCLRWDGLLMAIIRKDPILNVITSEETK